MLDDPRIVVALISSVVSGLTVGLILMILKARMDRATADRSTASMLQRQSILDTVQAANQNTKALEIKVDQLTNEVKSISREIRELDKGQAVLSNQQNHLNSVIEGLKNDLSKAYDYFGKVVRKP